MKMVMVRGFRTCSYHGKPATMAHLIGGDVAEAAELGEFAFPRMLIGR
jgi:hypothetical protein